MTTDSKQYFNYAFLILHYQTVELTKQCIKNIIDYFSDKKIIICIVDNASPNKSGELLKKEYVNANNVKILKSTTNQGFAKGNNIGFNYLKTNYEIDFMIVLNNDVTITDKLFLRKINKIYEKEQFDVIGPDIYAPKLKQHQNPQEYNLPNPASYEYWILRYKQLLWKEKTSYYIKYPFRKAYSLFCANQTAKIEQESEDINKRYENNTIYNCILHGACIIFSKNFINQRDYAFYPETFMYFEEHILSLQCINKGYKIMYSPEIKVEHLCHATTESVFDKKEQQRWFFYKQATKSMSVYNKLYYAYHNITPKPKHILSTLRKLVILIAAIFLAATFASSPTRSGRTPIRSDAAGYYCYLPAIFIYHDLHCGFLQNGSSLAQQYQQEYGYPPETWFLNNTEKGWITKFSCGVAVCEMPGFLCACGLSKLFGYDCNGYSFFFKLMFILSNLIFSLAALCILLKLLKEITNNKTAAIITLAVALCTNVFYYSTVWAGSAHIYNLFFATLMLYNWKHFLDNPNNKNLIISGLAMGMIVLIRPTDCVLAAFPILYTILNGKLLKIFDFIKHNIAFTLIGSALFLAPIALQMIIWKITTGHFIYYSYQQEGFDFLHPHIIDGLFSSKKGWLIYTPIMIFAFVGMWFCNKKFNIPLITTLIIHCYIVFSWWCWWYGGSFGCRVMIVMYPLLAIPLARLLEKVTTKKAMAAVGIMLAFFMFWNVLQSYQVQKGILHYEDTDWTMYKQSLFKIRP